MFEDHTSMFSSIWTVAQNKHAQKKEEAKMPHQGYHEEVEAVVCIIRVSLRPRPDPEGLWLPVRFLVDQLPEEESLGLTFTSLVK